MTALSGDPDNVLHPDHHAELSTPSTQHTSITGSVRQQDTQHTTTQARSNGRASGAVAQSASLRSANLGCESNFKSKS